MPKQYPFQPDTSEIPTNPGVYTYRNVNGKIIYVGKAKNLRNRLTSYFINPNQLHPRTRKMLLEANSVNWTVVQSDVEALQLEYTWIKTFKPKFNVDLKDDKTFLSIAISVTEEFPRLFPFRGKKLKNIKYFGPFVHPGQVRYSIDELLKIFPVRTCTKSIFNKQKKLDRPCLLGYIGKCSAPCVGLISTDDHRKNIKNITKILSGNSKDFISDFEKKMYEASEDLNFEKAASYRNKINALENLSDKKNIIFDKTFNADFFGFVTDEFANASVQVFKIRNGKINFQEGLFFDRDLINSENFQFFHKDEVENFLLQYYLDLLNREKDIQDENIIPRKIYLSVKKIDLSDLSEAINEKTKVYPKFIFPEKGSKFDLMGTVIENANQSLERFKLNKANDIVSRANYLEQTKELLNLQQIPIEIECIDISHLNGTNVVGSLIKFVDALAKKSEYKIYNIKYAAGDGYSNDVESVKEVVFRRFTSKTNKQFPNLLVIDGGLPQVNAAYKVLSELNIENVELIGIAKRMEEIWFPNKSDPVILPRTSDALFLLQRVRDEAHNFAIRNQRKKRSRDLFNSELDLVNGLGHAKRKLLLNNFNSLDRIKSSSLEDLSKVRGIGIKLAQEILDTLNK